jgi:hypothetical protein
MPDRVVYKLRETILHFAVKAFDFVLEAQESWTADFAKAAAKSAKTCLTCDIACSGRV